VNPTTSNRIELRSLRALIETSCALRSALAGVRDLTDLLAYFSSKFLLRRATRLRCGFGFVASEAKGSDEGSRTKTVNGDGADDYEERCGEKLVRSTDAEGDERG
jgi:hypothetical protein